VIYEAASYPIARPRIDVLKLSELSPSNITAISTMFIPPREASKVDLNMVERLGLTVRPRAGRMVVAGKR